MIVSYEMRFLSPQFSSEQLYDVIKSALRAHKGKFGVFLVDSSSISLSSGNLSIT